MPPNMVVGRRVQTFFAEKWLLVLQAGRASPTPSCPSLILLHPSPLKASY